MSVKNVRIEFHPHISMQSKDTVFFIVSKPSFNILYSRNFSVLGRKGFGVRGVWRELSD
jgi:hypothetical protein